MLPKKRKKLKTMQHLNATIIICWSVPRHHWKKTGDNARKKGSGRQKCWRYAAWSLELHEGDLAVHGVLEAHSLASGQYGWWANTVLCRMMVWLAKGSHQKKTRKKRSPEAVRKMWKFLDKLSYLGLFCHFIKDKMGQNFHKIEAVRLEGGDPPSPPQAVSLTAL